MAAFIGIGFEIIGLLVAAVFVGQYLDEKYQAKGLIMAGFIVLALTGWLIHLVAMLKNFEREKQKTNESSSS